MAKTFKIAHNPTFQATVSIPRVGGDALEVPFTFKVKNRKELAKMFDTWTKQQVAMLKQGKEEEWDIERWADEEIALQVQQVKDVVVGWKFDDEFNDENIEALVTTAISVTEAITNCYNEAYTKARSGN